MTTYQRINRHKGYRTVTTVTEAGEYHHVAVWPDGFRAGEYTTTLEKMGWRSLEEFLSKKRGFEIVGEPRKGKPENRGEEQTCIWS